MHRHTRQQRAIRQGPLACIAFLWAAVLCGQALAGEPAARFVEPAMAHAAVSTGDLPPVAERLPERPLAMAVDAACPADRLGGTLRMIGGSAKDTRMLAVFGYARLVGYDETYAFVPDIAERFEVEDGRIFTFHLRPGMKWSDGAPFTSEDFRYFWEDMATNPQIARFGIPGELLVDGKAPIVTFPGPYEVRYEWEKPNPNFLATQAAALPFELYRPAHYLKQFHEAYADPAELAGRVEAEGQRNWAALHFKMDRGHRNDNPDLPTLQPWTLATEPPSERLIFARNPYFHRVDAQGRQLPYIDQVALTIANPDLIPAKVANGEADLQAAYLSFPNYPFLKRAEDRSGFEVRRWESGRGSHVTLYPNLNVTDAVWRPLVRNVDFRRALSLAINREDINKAIFYGLAVPGGNTVLPRSSLFDPELPTLWAGYDPEAANALLDGLGLERESRDGLRLLPDGRQMRIVVETAGESREQSDVLQLVRDDWRRLGIDLLIRESQREVFRNRIKAGSTLMSIWTGIDNGVPTPATDPAELAPSTAEQLQWPSFGMFTETHGEGGEAIGGSEALAPLRELAALRQRWMQAKDTAERADIWARMLRISADQVYTIGIVAGVDQIVAVSDKLNNVPERGVYNYEPGAYFGLYHPDGFWFDCDALDLAGKQE
ncbi:ABC transporter substrate-binding protein [Aurantimonas sp. A2-1-M11]|uniref:ABC transporter substrate-binding protein n=1 Tax=Aurantimonas sp. A2-1-M11 TaxID=3113712 RepID=UPI002F93AA4C